MQTSSAWSEYLRQKREIPQLKAMFDSIRDIRKNPSLREVFWEYCCEQWFLQGPRSFPSAREHLYETLAIIS